MSDVHVNVEKRCFTFCGYDECDCEAGTLVSIMDDAHSMSQDKRSCPHCHGTGTIALDTLAKRCYHLRLAKNVSLRQIPGISAAFFSQLETGKNTNPSAEKLIVIADFFGVSVDWLLGRKS